MLVIILFIMFSSTCFSRYCGHICTTYIILSEIMIVFNWYGVTAIQLTTSVHLFHLPTLMHNSLFINNMYVTLQSSKHVEDCNVTYILLMNKGIVH